jgi:uncharacterized protein (DUF362 family)
VGDSTTKAFSACGYAHFAKEMGVELVDTQKDIYETIDCKGIKIEICKSALAIDFMINLPVLKGHCQTLLTCALKNHKGVISDREKRRFHTLGLHKPIAHLNLAVRNDFIIVDGICGDLDFEVGGNPVFGGRMFAARDPVLCDAFAAALIGYNVSEIPYIGIAEKLGIGKSGPAAARELNKSSDAHSNSTLAANTPKSSGKVRQLSKRIKEENACSACYASLIYALSKFENKQSLSTEIRIGQGFKGKPGKIGVGQCASKFDSFCPGCPPTGVEVLQFLRELY